MSEKEKEAIEILKDKDCFWNNSELNVLKAIETVLNLIEKQEKEIEDNKIRLLQYENLRKHFNRMAKAILGEDYYNMAMDVYKSDEETCSDVINKKVKVSFPTKKMSEEIWKLKEEKELHIKLEQQYKKEYLDVKAELEKKDKAIKGAIDYMINTFELEEEKCITDLYNILTKK